MNQSRAIISGIKHNFPHKPFTARSLEDKGPCLGLAECVNSGHLKPYHVRYEKPGDFVAQIKFTVLLVANGSNRITSCTLQELQPTKTIEDPEIKGWLALSIKKVGGKNKKEAEHSRVQDSGVPSSADWLVVIKLWPSSKYMTLGYVKAGVASYHVEAR